MWGKGKKPKRKLQATPKFFLWKSGTLLMRRFELRLDGVKAFRSLGIHGWGFRYELRLFNGGEDRWMKEERKKERKKERNGRGK